MCALDKMWVCVEDSCSISHIDRNVDTDVSYAYFSLTVIFFSFRFSVRSLSHLGKIRFESIFIHIFSSSSLSLARSLNPSEQDSI